MKQVFIFAVAMSLFGCSSLMLQPVNFSWPVESVLKADANGMVSDSRYAVSFSITQLIATELGDTLSPAYAPVRLIRDRDGLFYITAPHFRNVYVFAVGDGGMKQYRKIVIADSAMTDPKFNQRDTYIELLNGSAKLALTKDGITEGDKK
jgi:zona occludens toxin (predicted ATPase)